MNFYLVGIIFIEKFKEALQNIPIMIVLKVVSKMDYETVLVYIDSKMEITMKDNLKMIKFQEMENIYGKMELPLLDYFKMGV
jgi:hypothetical protein